MSIYHTIYYAFKFLVELQLHYGAQRLFGLSFYQIKLEEGKFMKALNITHINVFTGNLVYCLQISVLFGSTTCNVCRIVILRAVPARLSLKWKLLADYTRSPCTNRLEQITRDSCWAR